MSDACRCVLRPALCVILQLIALVAGIVMLVSMTNKKTEKEDDDYPLISQGLQLAAQVGFLLMAVFALQKGCKLAGCVRARANPGAQEPQDDRA